jgi:hypothetical protein
VGADFSLPTPKPPKNYHSIFLSSLVKLILTYFAEPFSLVKSTGMAVADGQPVGWSGVPARPLSRDEARLT